MLDGIQQLVAVVDVFANDMANVISSISIELNNC